MEARTLEQQWRSAWSSLELVPAPREFEAVVARYSEPHRRYHTLQHLQECLAGLEELAHDAVRPGEVAIALWFHDAVYDVRRHDNEERSAALAAESLSMAGASGETIERVRAMILATREHAATTDTDTQIVLDIDLSILGATPARFREYEEQIREEYRHVPSLLFAWKRKSILQGFLDRSRIFGTQPCFDRYERQARLNLASAMAK